MTTHIIELALIAVFGILVAFLLGYALGIERGVAKEREMQEWRLYGKKRKEERNV